MPGNEDRDVFHIMFTTRAMRRLKPDPVPEDLLLRLIDAAQQAASGSNRQQARFVIVRDAVQKQRLAALNKVAVDRYVAPSSGRPAALPHQPAEKRRRMLDAVVWQAEHFHEMPALIVPCLEFDAVPADTFEEGEGAASSIFPAVQNLLLAARALGLGATLTTLGLSDIQAAKAALGLPDNVHPFCIVPVGYPTGRFGPVSRLPVEQIVHWDRW